MATRGLLRSRSFWYAAGLVALPLWGAGQVARRLMYAPHYPDIALHAGLALVARPRRVLAIAAHPRQLELHAGGTLFLMARARGAITAAVLTTGAARPRRNAAEVHRREQEQAASILGYGQLVQLDLPAGGLTEHPLLGAAVRRVWNEVNPDVVLAPDPRGLFPLHPDSTAAGIAAVHTAVDGEAPGTGSGPAAPEVPDAQAALGRAALAASRERVPDEPRVLLYGSRRPNVLVDVTEVLPEKLQGVKAHRSQLRGPDRLADPAVRMVSRLFRGGTPALYVEGFYRVL